MIFEEKDNSLFLHVPAEVVPDNVDMASTWASDLIFPHERYKWILGRYVEADKANSNGQAWSLNDLRDKHHTVRYSPMNINHYSDQRVGAWVGSELLYPEHGNPYVQVLGVMWKDSAAENLSAIEAAFNSGSLFLSMETVAESVTCMGDCGQTFDYAGPQHSSYCDHINSREAGRMLNNPTFLGGALIVGIKPGWNQAYVDEVASSEYSFEFDDVAVWKQNLDKFKNIV